jgi:hypothetical protein
MIDGHNLPVAQVAHDRIILDEPYIPRNGLDSFGEITMTIDGVERKWPVRLAPLNGTPSRIVPLAV